MTQLAAPPQRSPVPNSSPGPMRRSAELEASGRSSAPIHLDVGMVPASLRVRAAPCLSPPTLLEWVRWQRRRGWRDMVSAPLAGREFRASLGRCAFARWSPYRVRSDRQRLHRLRRTRRCREVVINLRRDPGDLRHQRTPGCAARDEERIATASMEELTPVRRRRRGARRRDETTPFRAGVERWALFRHGSAVVQSGRSTVPASGGPTETSAAHDLHIAT